MKEDIGFAAADIPEQARADTEGGGSVASHTPGPWADRGEASYENSGPCRGISADAGSHYQTVAHVVGWDDPESIANARLIAAAPDLLAACRLVRSINAKAALVGYCHPEVWGDDLFAAQRVLSAAIMKAERQS